MNNENKKLLDDVIKVKLENLMTIKSLPDGAELNQEEVNELAELYKLRIEEEKCEQELQNEIKQLQEQKLERRFKYGVMAGLGVLQLAFYATWVHVGLKFEESGTLRSNVFRSVTNCFKPRFK